MATHFSGLGAIYDTTDGTISVMGGLDGTMMTMSLTVEGVFECCENRGKILAESGMVEGMTDMRVLYSEDCGFELDIRLVRGAELWVWRCGEEMLLEMFDEMGRKLSREEVSELSAQVLSALDAAEDDEPETVH